MTIARTAAVLLGLTPGALSGCGGVGRVPPISPPDRFPVVSTAEATREVPPDETVAQILLRDGRTKNGALYSHSAASLADEAICLLLGFELPFDAWGDLTSSPKELELVAIPPDGLLASAVLSRLQQAAGDPPRVRLLGTPRDASGGRNAWIITPRWQDGRMIPDPAALLSEWRKRGGSPPEFLMLDLLEVDVDGSPWPADEVIVASSAQAAAFASEFALKAHAMGRVPDAESLALKYALDLERLDWRRQTLVK